MVEKINKVYKDVDFCVTYFLRRNGLTRLLESINKYYPRADITIANQGDEELDFEGCTIFKLPFDYGLSASRNYLVKNTEKPYMLILEDDFVFNDYTDIKLMKELLEMDKDVGVVGGRVKENGQDINFEQYFYKNGRTLEHVNDGNCYYKYRNITYKETGSVLNFALFKREVFNDLMWDDRLKLADHTDFYLRMKDTKWKVLHTPNVIIDTKKDVNTPEYKELKRREDFKKIMFDKHDIDKIVYLNGYEMKYDREKDKIIKGRNLK